MGRRQAIAVTALLALAGAGAGYATAQAADEPAVSSDPAAPIPAVPLELTPDPDQPALPTGVSLVQTSFGESPTRLTFGVPAGWKRITNASNEYRWKVPDHPEDTYVLRVEQVTSQSRTIAQHRDDRIRWAAEERAFMILDRSGSGLEYTYIDDLGQQRHLFVRWLDLEGNPNAEVEINMSARERDVAGAAELVERVAASMVQD